MKEEIKRLVLYRMERAKEAITEAELLFSEGPLYNRLFDAPQKADYADLVKFEADIVATWFDEVRSFVDQIDTLVVKVIHSPG